MKKMISVLLALAMVLSLSACGGSSSGSSGSSDDAAEGEKVLKVAVACSLTGMGAKAGTAFEEATRMAFEEIDHKIGDYTIVPIYVDVTDDPEKGALAMEQAIVKDGAQVMTQGWYTTIAMAHMDVAAKYQIPYLFNYGAGSALDEKWATNPEKYSYYIGKTYPTNDFLAMEYRDLMNGAFESGALTGDKTVAIYGEDTDWGHSIGELLDKYFSEGGFEVVLHEYYAAGSTDLYAFLSKIQSTGASVVAGTSNNPASAAAFLKQAEEIGLEAAIIAHSLNENADWYELTGDAAEGAFDQMAAYKDERGPDFEARWMERMGYAASIFCESVAYDNALMFIDALQKCYDMYGVLDSETIYKFGCEVVQGGNYSFDSIIQPSYRWEPDALSPIVGEDAFYNPLGQVQGGEFKIVFPAARAEVDPVF